MVDNIRINPGSGGENVASDDIGGVQHQRVKVQHGADGSAIDVSTASPLPIGDPLLEIARGNRPGMRAIHVQGNAPTIGTGVKEEVWPGGASYSYPSSAVIDTVLTAVNDPGLLSAEILIEGLDAAGGEITQTVTMDMFDTANPVTLLTPIWRINSASIQANVVGTENVDFMDTGLSTLYGRIEGGKNKMLQAIRTVPTAKKAYITVCRGDVAEGTAGANDPRAVQFFLSIADRANGYEFQEIWNGSTSKETPWFKDHLIPYLEVGAMCDIRWQAMPLDKPCRANAGFSMILVDN